MNNYITVVMAFIIGQFAYTSITVYNLQVSKDISYWAAYKAYMKKETGLFVIAIAGLCCVLFILSDFVDLNIHKSDLLNKDALTYKEKLIVYFRTIALFVGAFITHILFKVYAKGKEGVEVADIKLKNNP